MSSSTTATTSTPEDEFHFVFGFGSIMNSSTHAAWLPNNSENDSSSKAALPGRIVKIKREFGYERRWNFRSTTGFTALGVSRIDPTDFNPSQPNMNGVLLRVPIAMMPGFDKREKGYDKVQIPLEFIELCDNRGANSSSSSSPEKQQPAFELTKHDKIWMYVPQPSQNREADENHPLLQSYVDTVLQGCLEWGGEEMGIDFVLSTGSWSPYFLNDTPSSRRPWLFRKDYDIIDAILRKHSARTHYADRRHPEEFASKFLSRSLRGTWSLPRRNRNFTGRDLELGQLHNRLTQQPYDDGVNFCFVQGMGGVGKSSICTEYCYRHFPSSYGLVVWLNAESAETLVADYRQLLADLVADDTTSAAAASNKDNNNNNNSNEVIGEVKTRLFRCQVPWLLVFDNLEDRKVLEKFVPRGVTSGSKGYVLVTSRVVELESGSGPSSLVLGCLSPSESVEMLRRALGSSSSGSSSGASLVEGSKEEAAAKQICEKLGHLPLALGMAAAYMQRCDVSCVEYVDRYVRSEETGRSLLRHQAGRLHDYSLTVASSLALSLKAIEKESSTASEILRLLCWLGPDHITKALLRGLLSAKNKADEQRRLQETQNAKCQSTSSSLKGALFLSCGLLLGTVALLPTKRSNFGSRLCIGSGLLAALSFSASLATMIPSPSTRSSQQQTSAPPTRRTSNSKLALDVFEQADIVWNILKSFSILTVKEGKGSMHRLLSEALRSAQGVEESCHHLKTCVDAMPRIWKFNPWEANTWEDSFFVVEHVKSLVSRVADNEQTICPSITLQAGILSTEAGVFSAMATNGFKEAQASLELALKIFDSRPPEIKSALKQTTLKAKAEARHELGRVLRYQGDFDGSEKTLLSALSIRNELVRMDPSARNLVADTLHELGVLEVKKHSLETAEEYLTKALDLRRDLEQESGDVDADCAATLHQLASIHVARKPPSLNEAEALLQEALALSRQIAQRAATLKQLARVAIRQGLLDKAESYLSRALELYQELYGGRLHMNVGSVKFQMGALANQREQYDEAWRHFSECLRIRRSVYAYARPHDTAEESNIKSDPLHLEVSVVVHELGCVSFAQGRFSQSLSMLQAERTILQKLQDASNQTERLRQAMLTNLTWLRKCAKEMGDEVAVAEFTAERAQLKSNAREKDKESSNSAHGASDKLQREAINCRLYARKYALAKSGDDDAKVVFERLSVLAREIDTAASGTMKRAAQDFHDEVIRCLQSSNVKGEQRNTILKACDMLRDILRAHGTQVSDKVTVP